MDNIKTKSDWGLVLYLVFSFSVLLFIGQDNLIERGSLIYILILLPPFFFSSTKLSYLVCNAIYKVWPILLLLFIAMVWGLKRNDLHAIPRAALFLFVLSWLEISSLKIKINTLGWIYLGLVFSSIVLYVLIPNLNLWGLIPGSTIAEVIVWRVSFFPNIATSAFLSLIMFMVITKDKETFSQNKFVAFISLYFLVFSFVRTAFISLIAYIVFYYFFNKIKNHKWLYSISLLSAFLLNCIVAYSAQIIYNLQFIPLVSRLFLRGYHSLSQHDISVQMYRPWLWKQQINIFLNSPFLMGEGLYDFSKFNLIIDEGRQIETTDSVSLLLSLLASYGISAVLFYFYLLYKNYKNAINLDSWACAVFPIIIFICMQWGSIFHPASALFVLFFLVLLKGKNAYL